MDTLESFTVTIIVSSCLPTLFLCVFEAHIQMGTMPFLLLIIQIKTGYAARESRESPFLSPRCRVDCLKKVAWLTHIEHP